MNFKYSPLLASRPAYWVCVALMAVSTAALFVFLKRRKWL